MWRTIRTLAFVAVGVIGGDAGCNGRVSGPPGVDGGDDDVSTVSDAGAGSDAELADAAFCDSGINAGYCSPGFHCELYQGTQHTWNVCCPVGEDASANDCELPSH